MNRDVGDVQRAAEHQPADIGVGICIPAKLLRHKPLHREIACKLDVFRFSDERFAHAPVYIGSELPENIVPAFLITAVDHVVALLQLVNQGKHLVGGRLLVVVEGDHNVAGGVGVARHQRAVLSEVSGQINAEDVPVLAGEGLDQRPDLVGRIVVDENNFVVIAILPGFHRLDNLFYHGGQGIFRTEAGHDEGYLFFHEAAAFLCHRFVRVMQKGVELVRIEYGVAGLQL